MLLVDPGMLPDSTSVLVASTEAYVQKIFMGSESEAFSKWWGMLAGTKAVSKTCSGVRTPSISTTASPWMTITDSATLWR